MAPCAERGTVSRVQPVYELGDGENRIVFATPDIDTVCCFLSRVGTVMDLDDVDDVPRGFYLSVMDERAGDAGVAGFEDGLDGYLNDDADGDLEDVFDGDFDDGDDLDTEYADESEVWEVAGAFGIGQFSPSWWMLGEGTHDEGCTCRPAGLLEILQYHAPVPLRQSVLDVHLAALRSAWDHFWSGDALINGGGDRINGACVGCLTEGAEHLSRVVDEARQLAEELGEALAAFHSQINIGLDRY